LSEADRCDVPIIKNHDSDKAILQIILQVIDELSRHFEGTPRDVFGGVVDDVQHQVGTELWHQHAALLGD
jgi:hypothetical protein